MLCSNCDKSFLSKEWLVLSIKHKPTYEQGSEITLECPDCGAMWTVTGYAEWSL